MRQLQLKNPLGSGSFGTVYRADLLSGQGLRRAVAIKVISRSHDGREMFLARIRDEARLLGLLEDDHILKVLELVQVDGRDGVLMEYVDGVDLATLVEQQLIPPPRALASLGSILSGALHKAHTAVHPGTGAPLNVVHRDVKPANIMLTTRGGVKLLDFGVAKAAFEARESKTGRMVLGTLNYIAPEYLVTGQVAPPVDIYGLGLTLVEAVTGQRFGAPKLKRPDFESRREAMLQAMPPAYAPMLPILRQMLAWEANERPDGATAENALQLIADELSGTGLRSWAAQAIPEALGRRPAAPDGEGLAGRLIDIEQGEQLAAAPPEEPETVSRAAEPRRDASSAGMPPRGERPASAEHTAPAPAKAAAPKPNTKSDSPEDFRRTIVMGLLAGAGLGVVVVAILVAALIFLR